MLSTKRIYPLTALLHILYLYHLYTLLIVIMPPQTLPRKVIHKCIILDPSKTTHSPHIRESLTKSLASRFLVENYKICHIYNINRFNLYPKVNYIIYLSK